MINIGTYLKIADNSGGVLAKCINVSRISYKQSLPGHIITIVIQKNILKKNVLKKSKIITKGMICKALILRTKKGFRRWGSFFIKCFQNYVILINNFFVPYGTRFFGLFLREIRNNLNFKKLVSIAKITL